MIYLHVHNLSRSNASSNFSSSFRFISISSIKLVDEVQPILASFDQIFLQISTIVWLQLAPFQICKDTKPKKIYLNWWHYNVKNLFG